MESTWSETSKVRRVEIFLRSQSLCPPLPSFRRLLLLSHSRLTLKGILKDLELRLCSPPPMLDVCSTVGAFSVLIWIHSRRITWRGGLRVAGRRGRGTIGIVD